MNKIKARKLHSLLKLAIDDLKKVERLPKKYIISMHDWHNYDEDTGKCRVCMAGAVLACTVKIGKTTSVGSETEELDRQTSAINALRCGRVAEAYEVLYQKTMAPAKVSRLDDNITSYNDDKEQFHEDIKRLHATLKKNRI